MQFPGLHNENFFSPHYVDEVLKGDLKDLLARWAGAAKEDGIRPPQKKLERLADGVLSATDRARQNLDTEERFDLARREVHVPLLEALGYAAAPDVVWLEDETAMPVLARYGDENTQDLWVIETPFPEKDDDDPLAALPLEVQIPEAHAEAALPVTRDGAATKDRPATWRELLDGPLFALEVPPRRILVLCGREIILADRHKWPEGRVLRFDLSDILQRKEKLTFDVTAALLHKDALAPGSGPSLLETLDENSHKHAFAVSADLKYGVRRAVELLGNEAIHHRRASNRRVVTEPEMAARLTEDCLTYIYRLLFLFYVEARGTEAGVVPMNSEAYREGYSLEALRDLELVPLEDEHARNGFYIHESLERLFRLLNRGFQSAEAQAAGALAWGHGTSLAADDTPLYDELTLSLEGLDAPLFDDERFNLLKGVRFRNHVLQEVIQLLSLSASKRGARRGRISYADLGISQLGAIHEWVLSYDGFFATEPLLEVASKDTIKGLARKSPAEREKEQTWFVPATDMERYDADEILRDEHARPIEHARGTYLFRLAGRKRERSASYYTPQVLTECLVKYALKELLENEDGTPKLSAAEILDLTICEPAMGSAAFLLEAVDQLAHAYLKRRQEELSQKLPSDRYAAEHRRVMARLAMANCHGVDLNETAVTLAQVSMWLGTLAEGVRSPWYGFRLAHGNSLVGARREAWPSSRLIPQKSKAAGGKTPWTTVPPTPFPFRDDEGEPHPLPKNHVFHWLLPDPGMSAFEKDKVVKEHWPEAAEDLKEWRKAFCNAPLTASERERLVALSKSADRLWRHAAQERHTLVEATTDRPQVWEEAEAQATPLSIADRERAQEALEAPGSATTRLRLAMDAWCALWFWPLEHTKELPSREEWLGTLELLLEGQLAEPETQASLFRDDAPIANAGAADSSPTVSLTTASSGPTGTATAPRRSEAAIEVLRDLDSKLQTLRAQSGIGHTDTNALIASSAWLSRTREIATAQPFLHWELQFAEVFSRRGGFDLVIGNPPWIKLQWMESGLLEERDPLLALRKTSASALAAVRNDYLADDETRELYAQDLATMEGGGDFLNSGGNYPLLLRQQTNLYKCFITRCWRLLSTSSALGLVHPEGIFDDPKGGSMRREVYRRLRHHYQFVNEGLLFSEVSNHAKYSLNVYRGRPEAPRVNVISNLIHPQTTSASSAHDGTGQTPGIKTEDDRFETRGHANRLLTITGRELALFARLYDAPGTPPEEARLPVLHSQEILAVLQRFADAPRRLADLGDAYTATEMWHETNAQKDGTIRRETRFPTSADELILQGPHFFVGTPLFQTPNEVCDSNRAYTRLDLTALEDDFLPRTNYVPACDPATYRARTPTLNGRPLTDFYRHVHRRISSPTGERTLISGLAPPGPGHVNPVLSIGFQEDLDLLRWNAAAASLPYDFIIKSGGKGDIYPSTVARMPFLSDPRITTAAARILRLVSTTRHFSELWNINWREFSEEAADRKDWPPQDAPWTAEVAYRRDGDRRSALIEIDVLVAQALGMTIEELCTIYRIQFPVLQQYERANRYDQNGRLVPDATTVNKAPAVSMRKLAAALEKDPAVPFDTDLTYEDGTPETETLLAAPFTLPQKDADLLGVTRHGEVRRLMASSPVTNHAPSGPITRTLWGLSFEDPALYPLRRRTYPTPWTAHDRESDYRTAWAHFERTLGRTDDAP